jgi:hypothetical protein
LHGGVPEETTVVHSIDLDYLAIGTVFTFVVAVVLGAF